MVDYGFLYMGHQASTRYRWRTRYRENMNEDINCLIEILEFCFFFDTLGGECEIKSCIPMNRLVTLASWSRGELICKAEVPWSSLWETLAMLHFPVHSQQSCTRMSSFLQVLSHIYSCNLMLHTEAGAYRNPMLSFYITSLSTS